MYGTYLGVGTILGRAFSSTVFTLKFLSQIRTVISIPYIKYQRSRLSHGQ